MTPLEICALIALIIFAVIAIFIIRTLIILQRFLGVSDSLLKNVQAMVNHFNPLFRTLSNLGDVAEKESIRFKEAFSVPQEPKKASQNYDLLEWLLLSVKLGEKFINRR